MNRTMLGVLMCSAVHAASAQIIRPTVVSRPAGWTSLAVGWAQQQTICDPATNACWNFAGAAQYRGSLELPLGDAGAWGVAVTSSRVPLVWAGTASANSCFQCDADVNITQYLGIIRMSAGSASGFQQIVELGAGATQFTNFRTAGGSQLGTGKAVTDFSFAAAYGFGYNLQSRLQLFLVQEYGLMIHKRQTGSPNNSAQQQTFRVGARLGLGDRH